MQTKIFKHILVYLLFLTAILLRFHAFFTNNSFFLDEAILAVNVITLSFKQLFFPLLYTQTAPFLFLMLSKTFIKVFGYSELVFRFIPFLLSLSSLFLFYALLNRLFNNFWVKMLAFTLFITNFQLLFYTQTFKPYMGDVFCCLLLLLIFFKNNKIISSTRSTILFGLSSAFLFCFSFTAIFLIITFFIYYLFFEKNIKKSIYFLIPNFIIILLYFMFNLKVYLFSPTFINGFANGFNIFSSTFFKMNYDFFFAFYNYPIILTVLLILGIHYTFKSNNVKYKILPLIIISTLLASILKFYPFERRLILFLLPILLILLTFPLEQISQIKNKYLKTILIIICSMFFAKYFINYTNAFLNNKISYLRQDFKPLLNMIINEKKETDNIYIYYGSNILYYYYSYNLNLPKKNIYIGTPPKSENLSNVTLLNDLQALPKNQIFWFIFAKGNSFYQKDLTIFNFWIKNNGKIEKDISLKQTRLIKVKL